MNLREQIEKEITDKVMTKLASEKVELGIVDNIEKSVNRIYDELQSANVILNKAGVEAEDIGKNQILRIDNATDSVKKASDMAKDLGIDIPQIKNLKTRLSSAEKTAKAIMKRAKSAQ